MVCMKEDMAWKRVHSKTTSDRVEWKIGIRTGILFIYARKYNGGLDALGILFRLVVWRRMKRYTTLWLGVLRSTIT